MKSQQIEEQSYKYYSKIIGLISKEAPIFNTIAGVFKKYKLSVEKTDTIWKRQSHKTQSKKGNFRLVWFLEISDILDIKSGTTWPIRQRNFSVNGVKEIKSQQQSSDILKMIHKIYSKYTFTANWLENDNKKGIH